MHKLLTDSPGTPMLMLGNEAIARGAIEAGVAFGTAYPGTPSSEISTNLFQVAQQSDLYFEFSINEKVALEVAAGAANSGLRTICTMKHVGLNVAADPLMTLAYVGVRGSLVIISADDPSMYSSQNEQDNRYYAKLSGLPMLEPSTVAEAKEMVIYAFDLSEELQQPVILRTTTRINHSSAVVPMGTIRKPRLAGDFSRDPFRYVPVPAVARKLHVRLLDQLVRAEEIGCDSPFNLISGQGRWGVVCNGVSLNYVQDAVKDLEIDTNVKILRLGFSHPLPTRLVLDFLKDCEKILIVEEGEPFMEEAIKALAQQAGFTFSIKGKGPGLFSRLYEFHPAMVRQVVASYFGINYEPPARLSLDDLPPLPARPPNLCAGCSHRATFYAVKKAARGMDVVFPTDIGCYSLGFLPPLSIGDFMVCMGASVSSGCGFAKALRQKIIAIIGDSTFLHSGMTGLVNAVHNNHNLTLIILDNGTTAMTGHQPHPGTDMKRLGLEGYNRISIEAIVRAIGVGHVTVIKPYKIQKSITAIQQALAHPGVSVVIAEETCALYARQLKMRRRRAFQVSDKCKNHRLCIQDFACPAFYLDESRVQIDPDVCVGCTVCAQICPEKAIIPIQPDRQASKSH